MSARQRRRRSGHLIFRTADEQRQIEQQLASEQQRKRDSGRWPKSAAERIRRLNRSVALAEQHHLTGTAVFQGTEDFGGVYLIHTYRVRDPRLRSPQSVSVYQNGDVTCGCPAGSRWEGLCRHCGALPQDVLSHVQRRLEARQRWEERLAPLKRRAEREQREREQQRRDTFLVGLLPGCAPYWPAVDAPVLGGRAMLS